MLPNLKQQDLSGVYSSLTPAISVFSSTFNVYKSKVLFEVTPRWTLGSRISVKKKLSTGTLHPKVNEIEESGLFIA
ncbi:hypothetical protein ACFVAD_01485 [Sutcliffiella sp. NPDC057660]|uniref:hypothetical protein n=1 Tax=Sutcliffiella sp. NPDC057660 TaxID=3346199 RepID=UPI0036A7CA88